MSKLSNAIGANSVTCREVLECDVLQTLPRADIFNSHPAHRLLFVYYTQKAVPLYQTL